MNWLDEVVFNETGLVPVITQDAQSGRVLMLAWANREALAETISTGRGVYFSRSRGKLWRKGEESGNIQGSEVRLDCDGDAVLYVVTQVGGMACHTGRENCPSVGEQCMEGCGFCNQGSKRTLSNGP